MVLRRLQFLLVGLALAATSSASAQETDPPADSDPNSNPLAIDVHGFVSQGFLVSARNNYLATKSTNGSFEFAEVGINFTKQISDQLRAGIQLFAHDLGPLGNYDATFDWFYLDYHWKDWLGLRAGRVKLPFGLYNEINDIDAARPFVLLPQSIYPVSNRDFLLAQTGFEVYGYIDLDCWGAIDYRAYGGTVLLQANSKPSSPVQIDDINIPYVVGGRVLWETPLEGLRAGASVQLLRLDADLLFAPGLYAPLQMAGALPADFNGLVEATIPSALLAVGSIEYSAYDVLIAAEYSRWHTELESSQPLLQPETKATAERAYLLAAYRFNAWFQPGAYYALYFPDEENRHGRENQQHDVALVLRFDLNEHWLFKLEGHFMSGTAELQPQLNDNTPKDQLKRNWGLLLAKTTAYF